MVTTENLVAFQQQLRLEMTHVIQQLRTELNVTVNGRIGMLSSTNRALRNVSAKPAASKPHRISDFIPRNWERSNDKGEFRHFMSDLHLWMQAWSYEGERMLVSVESSDKFDNSTLAVDCADKECRTIDASLYHVLHRSTANEPMKIVQQNKGTEGIRSVARDRNDI